MRISQKTLLKTLKTMKKDELMDLASEYFDRKQDKTKKPKAVAKHIGLELECTSDINRLEAKILKEQLGLNKYMSIGNDGSIEAFDDYSYELRLLMKESELKSVLTKLGKFLKKGKFHVNESCGLHVHIDMRTRQAKKCYNKLVKFENVLFSLVDEDRWNNNYCLHTSRSTISHRKAINFTAVKEHNTIEIRLHDATCDMKRVENWIKLLINVVDAKSVPKITKFDDVFKWQHLDKKLVPYIKDNGNDQWFHDNYLLADEVRVA